MNASEVSLIIETNWLTKEGIMFRSAWGRMMWVIACLCDSPVETAASICPFGIPRIPARTISDM